MLSKRDNGARPTIVGTDTRIEGDMRFVGVVVIDGYVNGNITAGKDENVTLAISENGHVKGSVAAPHLLINGMVEGEVRATDRLELGPEARVIGDVQYNLMEMSIGAQVDGKLIPKSQGALSKKIRKRKLTERNPLFNVEAR